MSTNGTAQDDSTSPSSVLILGAGVFGLSTALALLDRPNYNNTQITVIDSSSTLPNPHGSSVDSSRIIRADYANPIYAKLASQAQLLWRDTSPSGWGGEGRYQETGFVLTADGSQTNYVNSAMGVVQELAKAGLPLDFSKIQELPDQQSIRSATRYEGVSGDKGYANWNSGWADAERCVSYALQKLKSHPTARNRLTIRPGTKASSLILDQTTGQCKGVRLEDDSHIYADLTVVAAGAWSPTLIDLQNRAVATGQVLAYIKTSPEEQAAMGDRPVVINLSQGTFLIPPTRCELKIARHGFGYRNLKTVSLPSGQADGAVESSISVPRTDVDIPAEAVRALRYALAEYFPPTSSDISTRPFTHTRLCWYTDTPEGNFIISHHPQHQRLFVATGGSGHGFKFFPVLGDKIVDAIEHRLDDEYAKIWAWPEKTRTDFVECEDGSRAGPRGMLLEKEMTKAET